MDRSERDVGAAYLRTSARKASHTNTRNCGTGWPRSSCNSIPWTAPTTKRQSWRQDFLNLCKRKKPVPEGPCADDGFTASVLRPFGYRLLNEAAGRHAVCFNVDWSRGKEGRFGQATLTRSKSKARPKQAYRETATLPLRGGFFQVPETRSSSSQKRSERGREVLATR